MHSHGPGEVRRIGADVERQVVGRAQSYAKHEHYTHTHVRPRTPSPCGRQPPPQRPLMRRIEHLRVRYLALRHLPVHVVATTSTKAAKVAPLCAAFFFALCLCSVLCFLCFADVGCFFRRGLGVSFTPFLHVKPLLSVWHDRSEVR